MTTPQIVHPDDEEAVGIQRSARPDDVVPPADIVRLIGIVASDVVMSRKGVAHQDGVRLRGVEGTVGFIDEVVLGNNPAAAQVEGLGKMGPLRFDLSDALLLSCHSCSGKRKTRWLIADRVFFNRPRFSRICRAPAS